MNPSSWSTLSISKITDNRQYKGHPHHPHHRDSIGCTGTPSKSERDLLLRKKTRKCNKAPRCYCCTTFFLFQLFQLLPVVAFVVGDMSYDRNIRATIFLIDSVRVLMFGGRIFLLFFLLRTSYSFPDNIPHCPPFTRCWLCHALLALFLPFLSSLSVAAAHSI